jgi:putative ABC transport system permease protein
MINMKPKLKRFFRQARLIFLLALGLAVWIKLPLVVVGFAVLFVIWLLTSQVGAQSLAITWVGLSTVPQRLGATSVIIVGIAGVVGVFIALLAMAEGFDATLREAGSDDTVIILRSGANAELSSGLDRATVTLITEGQGILRDAEARPITSAEVVVVANLPKKSSGTAANVEVRGVGSQVWSLRPSVHIIAGRKFKPGLRELVVGEGAFKQFAGLELSATVLLNSQAWKVVGIFASGDTHASEIWGDAEQVAGAYRRNGFQSVTARLMGPDSFDLFKASVVGDPRLKVDVQTTRAYYNKQSERLTKTIRGLGTGIAVIMAIGAGFGALNTMYSAVADRAREIATLRALGFSGLPVMISALLEAMILALIGGLLGTVIAYALFNGYTASTLGSNFSQVVFQFHVSPTLLLDGLQWALAIGFIGGFFPALQAASIPVSVALREL